MNRPYLPMKLSCLAALCAVLSCTSEVGAFCSRLDECGENFVGNNVTDCEVAVEEVGEQLDLDAEACAAELGAATEAASCEAFGQRDLCSLCSPRLMSFLLSQRWPCAR